MPLCASVITLRVLKPFIALEIESECGRVTYYLELDLMKDNGIRYVQEFFDLVSSSSYRYSL
jgi:hypothetical protein